MAEPTQGVIDLKIERVAPKSKSNSRPRLTTALRFIRVANSVLCGSVCLLIIFFWVRSYSYVDDVVLKIAPSEHVMIHAGDGRMCIRFEHKSLNKFGDWWSRPITKHTQPNDKNRIPRFGLTF